MNIDSQSTQQQTYDSPNDLEAALFAAPVASEPAADTTDNDNVDAPLDDQAAATDAEAGAEPDAENEPGEGEGENDGEGEGEGDDGQEALYVVKIDGKTAEVTESELIAGYQRQSDYTQKTQALAEDRRQFEQTRRASMEELQNALAYYALPTAKEPKPEEFAGNPEGFLQAYNHWKQQKVSQDQASQALQTIKAAELQETLDKEAALLREKLPEWADDNVRQADYGRMMTAAVDRYGFSQEEIAQVTDHRLLILLRDATKAAEMEARPVVLKRTTQIKPKSAPADARKASDAAAASKAAIQKLKSQGTLSGNDAVAALFTK